MKAMTRQQLAAYAGVDVRTLRNWIKPHQRLLWRMGMPTGKGALPPNVSLTNIASIPTRNRHQSTRIDKNGHKAEIARSKCCNFAVSMKIIDNISQRAANV